jgi:hypothetical protein
MIGRSDMGADNTTVLWWSAAISGVAILVAPAVALWIQRKVDRNKAAEHRKQEIFKALWVNRRRPFYLTRVDALNMIDVEFYGEKSVLDAWQDLFAHYRDPHPGFSEAQIDLQREEKYSTLLYEISKALGYGFGVAHIRDNVYRPIFHDTAEAVDTETRQRFLALLRSDALSVKLVTSQPEENITSTPETSPDDRSGFRVLGSPPSSPDGT